MQSGVGGVFADLLFNDHSRFGQSASESFLLGIGAKPINDVIGLYGAGVGLEENADFTSKLTEKVLDYVPAKNLWYTRLAYERGVSDVIKSYTNPKHTSKLARQKKKMREETGQGYWYPPTK